MLSVAKWACCIHTLTEVWQPKQCCNMSYILFLLLQVLLTIRWYIISYQGKIIQGYIIRLCLGMTLIDVVFFFLVHISILSCREHVTSQVSFDPEVVLKDRNTVLIKQLLTSGHLQTDRLNMESVCQYKFYILASY